MTVMRQAPAIAILSPNVLTAIGLRSILEKVAPAAETELFGSFRDFEAAGPERFFHYFVTARLFVAHAAFFRERRHKTIVLSSASPIWPHGECTVSTSAPPKSGSSALCSASSAAAPAPRARPDRTAARRADALGP